MREREWRQKYIKKLLKRSPKTFWNRREIEEKNGITKWKQSQQIKFQRLNVNVWEDERRREAFQLLFCTTNLWDQNSIIHFVFGISEKSYYRHHYQWRVYVIVIIPETYLNLGQFEKSNNLAEMVWVNGVCVCVSLMVKTMMKRVSEREKLNGVRRLETFCNSDCFHSLICRFHSILFIVCS